MTSSDDGGPAPPMPFAPARPASTGGLQREVSLPMLVLYGLGTTVGAGIYALTGEVAGAAGMKAPLAFLFAATLAGITAFGFAELAGRLPRAAGEAVFVQHAFGLRPLSAAVGVTIMAAGVVAAAAITNAFGGYVSELTEVSSSLLIVILIAVLSGVAVIGARESVGTAAVITVVEILGLLLVVWTARGVFGDLASRGDELVSPPTGLDGWAGVLGGAFVAFFAFLGFEDIDSVAEETEEASVNLPRAIIYTLAITTVLYMLVSSVAVLQVAPAALADSDAPLALVYESAGGNPDILAAVAALAMVNGALVQLVMIPRVAYGLSRLGLLPSGAGVISARTHTPVRGTLVGAAVVAVFAIALPLGSLARLTSAATMAVFVAINAALIVIKRHDGPVETFEVPLWLPAVGIVASGVMFVAEVARLAGWT